MMVVEFSDSAPQGVLEEGQVIQVPAAYGFDDAYYGYDTDSYYGYWETVRSF